MQLPNFISSSNQYLQCYHCASRIYVQSVIALADLKNLPMTNRKIYFEPERSQDICVIPCIDCAYDHHTIERAVLGCGPHFNIRSYVVEI